MPLCWLMTVFMVLMLMFVMVDLFFYSEKGFNCVKSKLNVKLLEMSTYKW